LSDLTLILLAAGNSSRFGRSVKKQWLRIGHDPLWQYVTKKLDATGLFRNIIITSHQDDLPFMKAYTEYDVVAGGESRQQSLRNALTHVTSEYVMVSDIARACIDIDLLSTLIDAKEKADCIVPYLHVSDTVVYGDETINRDDVKRVQTPQLSKTAVLTAALESETEYTDESSAIIAAGGSRCFVPGHEDAHKITYPEDLAGLPCLEPPAAVTLVGNGFDVHAFDNAGEMFLGGVRIDSDFGFKAHSDGDVAIHALIDALLGAAGMGDIGMLFPDSDAAYENIDSKELLKATVRKLEEFGYSVVNADLTIAAQVPRLSPYKDPMRRVLSEILGIPPSRMNVKATTTERLGFVGREEGIAVMASAALNYFDWTRK
jgi:2-C-methyl-D-erythritol 4-phosphate cytidylyltransferase/2-C-methyl-D-erythritol 2,4-cyclodiphosphate synthase